MLNNSVDEKAGGGLAGSTHRYTACLFVHKLARGCRLGPHASFEHTWKAVVSLCNLRPVLCACSCSVNNGCSSSLFGLARCHLFVRTSLCLCACARVCVSAYFSASELVYVCSAARRMTCICAHAITVLLIAHPYMPIPCPDVTSTFIAVALAQDPSGSAYAGRVLDLDRYMVFMNAAYASMCARVCVSVCSVCVRACVCCACACACVLLCLIACIGMCFQKFHNIPAPLRVRVRDYNAKRYEQHAATGACPHLVVRTDA